MDAGVSQDFILEAGNVWEFCLSPQRQLPVTGGKVPKSSGFASRPGDNFQSRDGHRFQAEFGTSPVMASA